MDLLTLLVAKRIGLVKEVDGVLAIDQEQLQMYGLDQFKVPSDTYKSIRKEEAVSKKLQKWVTDASELIDKMDLDDEIIIREYVDDDAMDIADPQGIKRAADGDPETSEASPIKKPRKEVIL